MFMAGRTRHRLLIGLVLSAVVGLAFGVYHWTRPQPLPEPITRADARHPTVDCASLVRDETKVIMVLGQSNAANHGERAGPITSGVHSFHLGQCFQARDPLPGATGQGGSVWTHLAPRFLDPPRVRSVLLVPMAVTSTSIAQWNAHPALVDGLAQTVEALRVEGFLPDLVLWHQGEAESFKGTGAEDYRDGFARWLHRLRQLGVDAPVWVARATRCQQLRNDAVRAQQAALPALFRGVHAGPDLDALFDPSHRHDGCHFSVVGLEAAAQAWWNAIAAVTPTKS